MKITTKRDRIRLQAETPEESQAILAIHDQMFLSPRQFAHRESIVNDSGCRRVRHWTLNYCCIPHPLTPAQTDRAIDKLNRAA